MATNSQGGAQGQNAQQQPTLYRQRFYTRPMAQSALVFDGKRMRKAVQRRTIDYNASVIRQLEVTLKHCTLILSSFQAYFNLYMSCN